MCFAKETFSMIVISYEVVMNEEDFGKVQKKIHNCG